MKIYAYVKECLGPIRAQFSRRGFTVEDSEPQNYDTEIRKTNMNSYVPTRAMIESKILINDYPVGRCRIVFNRMTRVRRIGPEDLSLLTNGGCSVKSGLTIELFGFHYGKSEFPGIAYRQNKPRERLVTSLNSAFRHRTHNFRGDDGELVLGRPKVRRWAASAAKEFVKFMSELVDDSISHVMDS